MEPTTGVARGHGEHAVDGRQDVVARGAPALPLPLAPLGSGMAATDATQQQASSSGPSTGASSSADPEVAARAAFGAALAAPTHVSPQLAAAFAAAAAAAASTTSEEGTRAGALVPAIPAHTVATAGAAGESHETAGGMGAVAGHGAGESGAEGADATSTGRDVDEPGLAAVIHQLFTDEIAALDAIDPATAEFKSALPLARIKKIMKADEQVKMTSADALVVFSKACHIMIQEMVLRAWHHTEGSKRRTVSRADVAAALTKCDMFDFLIDILPRADAKTTRTDPALGSQVFYGAPELPALLLQQQQQQQQQQLEQLSAQLTAASAVDGLPAGAYPIPTPDGGVAYVNPFTGAATVGSFGGTTPMMWQVGPDGLPRMVPAMGNDAMSQATTTVPRAAP